MDVAYGGDQRKPTVLVGGYVLAGNGVLFIHLGLEVTLALLEHLELRAQADDGVLGRVLLLGRATAEPAPDARHDE